MWTHFWDMNSGGGEKEKWKHIYIEAPEDEAKVIFYNRFGHNPERVTCTCCGEDYSIKENESLEQLTGYHRNCAYKDGGYVEHQNTMIRLGDYITLDEYLKRPDILFIRADEIKPEERKGDVPRQGYIWCD